MLPQIESFVWSRKQPIPTAIWPKLLLAFFLSVSVSVLFGVFCSCIVVAVIVVAAAVVSAGLVA